MLRRRMHCSSYGNRSSKPNRDSDAKAGGGRGVNGGVVE